MKVNSVLETIGDTPHVRVNRLFDPRVEVWFKQERVNP
ncbi:MAG: cysteine synthase A, partial [Candidatus Dormibacteria bacterium]